MKINDYYTQLARSAKDRRRINHENVLSCLIQNQNAKDKERFKEGYVPIHWLLAEVTYVEATNIGHYNEYNENLKKKMEG